MITAGIIAEYNVFHNGHLYQIRKIKEECDRVMVVMSGSFVQRGAAAITDKWQRAAAAVRAGADLVVELPVIYALNTAQKFAYGAVSLLDKCKAADRLYFGAECGDIDRLMYAAALLENEPRAVSEKIRLFVSQGMSFPSARQKAFSGFIDDELLSAPNNILALEYIRALNRLGSKIKPCVIKRKGAEHDSSERAAYIASASEIRRMIFARENYLPYVPCEYNNVPYDIRGLENALIYRLRSMNHEELSRINETGEGIENRIIRAAASSVSLETLCERVKTKRYTRSRINRILLSALLGLTKDICDIEPSYIRVLALSRRGGGGIIREIRNSGLDVITKTADYKADGILFEKDILATDIAALCAPEPSMRRGGLDYLISPAVPR